MTRTFASPLLAVSAAVTLAACYDWQIGGGPTDAGRPVDAPSHDAPLPTPDVGLGRDAEDAQRDAPSPTEAGPPSVDASAPEDATGPSCAALAADVSTKQALAQACTLGAGTECTTAVRDTCGCNTYAAAPSTTATNNYAAAVAAFADAGCVPTCTSCPEPGATTGTCLEMSTGSGVVSACSP